MSWPEGSVAAVPLLPPGAEVGGVGESEVSDGDAGDLAAAVL